MTLTLMLKIAFWTLLPPGAYRSVSQTHLDLLNCKINVFQVLIFACLKLKMVVWVVRTIMLSALVAYCLRSISITFLETHFATSWGDIFHFQMHNCGYKYTRSSIINRIWGLKQQYKLQVNCHAWFYLPTPSSCKEVKTSKNLIWKYMSYQTSDSSLQFWGDLANEIKHAYSPVIIVFKTPYTINRTRHCILIASP